MTRARPHPALAAAAVLLVATILATHAFIDLELALPVPLPGGRTWQANAPVADVAALALLPLALVVGLRHPRRLPPGLLGWSLLLLAAVLGVATTPDPQTLHHLVRKPLLVYLLYGVGLAWVIARLLPARAVRPLVAVGIILPVAVSLATSAGRIAAGDTLWFQRLEGLTPNHKTLAVCLAGWLPLLIGLGLAARARANAATTPQTASAPATPPTALLRRLPVGLVLAGLALLAILASLSKTALITAGLSLALFLPRGRPLAWRPRLLLPVAALAFALAYYAPVLLRSRTMLDAARSRHSLNVRSQDMFLAHPLVGAGSGTSTRYEMVTFPHYRVNGVDAHGVIQKTAAETGLLGLTGFGLFVWGAGRRLRDDWRDEQARHPDRAPTTLLSYGSLGCFVALHANLLLSTEVFSPTHWVPLAAAWGLSRRGEELA